ncbi:MAG: tripartite tricarboxylate transporter TctB family protein [Roseococcus sp.]
MTSRIPVPDLLAGLFVLGFGLVSFWQAAAIPVSPLYAQVGPKAVPYVVASGVTLLGALLVLSALRGGWSASVAEVVEAGSPNLRALGLLGAGLLANLVLIGPAGFSIAASAQFVLVAAAFGSRSMARDLLIALPLTLLVWFLFVQGLGVNIGAGLLEGVILQMLGQEVL